MMTLRKGYKYRLKTSRQHARQCVRFAGACRFVWNKILAINAGRYLAGVPRLSYHESCWVLHLWKQSEEYGWLGTIDSQVLQQCLKDLDRAYLNLYAGRAAPPTFRKKYLADSFRYPQRFKVTGNRVFLPKIGWARFFKSREPQGTVKNVTVSRDGNHWDVALQTEQEVQDPVHPSQTWVGMDLGVATFAALSTGELIRPLNALRRAEAKVQRAQQQLACKVKFSQNWKKQQARIRRLQGRIAHCRQDFLHQHSTRISKNHVVIVVENLQVRNMTRSARGTVEAPGRNVAAKAGLNKAILDQGWRTFRTMLEYKQQWRGGTVIAVSPRSTSQTCPNCGHVHAKNRVQQALFSCVACGYSYHADIVAAKIILARGQRERLNACPAPGAPARILGLSAGEYVNPPVPGPNGVAAHRPALDAPDRRA